MKAKMVLIIIMFHDLQAFTKAFMDCNPESSLKLACLSTIEEMLIPVSMTLPFACSFF